MSNKLQNVIGKTIKSITMEGLPGYDDIPFLIIGFTDETNIKFKSVYGGFTGKSEDEYPVWWEVVE